MSRDLISRSSVVEMIEKKIKLKQSYLEHNAQIDILFKVKELPASYDVGKAVEKIKENSFVPGDRIGVSDLKVIMSDKAVEIVKGGGLNG